MKYVERDGNVYMIVQPVQSLMHSSLISEVIARGDNFVVDMNTGALTILCKQKPAALAKSVGIIFTREDFTKRRLSTNWTNLARQLAYEWAHGNRYGSVKIICPGAVDQVVVSGGNWERFIEQVKAIFEAN